MTRVLITGASGFVGKAVLVALEAAGHEIVAIGRRPVAHRGVQFIAADLLDFASRQGALEAARASHLLHLAWIAEPGIYWQSPDNLCWCIATLDLLQKFREYGGERAVCVGSCAEYEWGEPRLRESGSPCRPATLYGIAKDATRRLGLAFAQAEALSMAWARLFFIYGPGEKRGRLIPDAIGALREGIDFSTTAGLHERDFLHVDDAAAALVTLLGTSVAGPVNIGSGAAIAVREVLGLLADQLGNRERLLFGARALSASEPAVIEADTQRLTAEVGFRPRFDLAAGLRDTVDRTR